jgi:hypothetical protein
MIAAVSLAEVIRLNKELRKSKNIALGILSHVKIIDAEYGDSSAKFIDVKSKIEKAIEECKYKISVNAHIFNCEGIEKDPAWGVKKVFKMRYILKGKEKSITVKDGEDITF